MLSLFFFCNDTATTEIYTYLHTLSLHDALPISPLAEWGVMIAEGQNFISSAWWITLFPGLAIVVLALGFSLMADGLARSEEHTSELQSLMRISYAVFCLKNKKLKKRTEYRYEHH